jgi:hypothetical protein
MEPTQLQLVLNVVMITGVASLAGYCYMLKKENRKLAAERGSVSRNERQDDHLIASVAIQPVEQDIRNFAAGRRSGWVQNITSSHPPNKRKRSGR